MRILLVSDPPLRTSFGGARPFIELADELERLGWNVTLRSLSGELPGDPARMRAPRARLLREIVRSEGPVCDVVDFDHGYLPYPRRELPADVLLVARSVLLCQQVADRSFPRPWTPRRLVGRLVRERGRRSSRLEMLRYAETTVAEADLVNVSNRDDRDLLTRHGTDPRKIVVQPFGLSEARAAEFEALPPGRGHANVAAFVGTFDWRKGAADMPAIVEQVASRVPGVEFRLLGTRGMFRSAREVAGHFPRRLRPRVEVVPEFDSPALPGLLTDCALGFFPSYLEGFGFGVLEMLAAALPVVAYDVPGPPMMLSEGLLVPVGDAPGMAGRMAELLGNPDRLDEARLAARRRSRDFRWSAIARETAAVYTRALDGLRTSSEVGGFAG
jgi:glycosyltransferase involved in cell wall biosynthesis